jgi:deoxyadenosine/deoxycytidine kinase
MDPNYLVIEGPIGVGKTSLVNLLTERFQARKLLEEVEDNPFLASFYGDRQKYAFQTQLFFLLSRFKQQGNLAQPDLFSSVTVSDYLFDKDRIFARLNLDPNEVGLYERVFEALAPRVVKPDLVLYLQARPEVLLQRIRRRGRDYERKFDPDYLQEVVHAYNHFFFHYSETPLLVVDTSDIDFVHNPGDLEDLVGFIRKMRRGTQHYVPRAHRPPDGR